MTFNTDFEGRKALKVYVCIKGHKGVNDMDLKKITAGAAAAALALSMTAVGAFAETIDIDSEYPGDWSSSGIGITKEAFTAAGQGSPDLKTAISQPRTLL